MRVFGFEVKKAKDSEIAVSGRLSEQEKAVRAGFERIREDITLQKKWLAYLHAKTEEIHKHSVEMSSSHSSHKEELVLYTNSVNSWINYLHRSNKKLELDLQRTEERLRSVIREDMKKYHSNLLLQLRESLQATNISKNNLKEEILQELKLHIDDRAYAKSEAQPRMEKSVSQEYILTPPEEELVRILFNENTPLTYEDLARKTGKSINSIRVYMNSAKTKRDIIDEFRKPSGEKIFSIKNKEKVKTLFNLA